MRRETAWRINKVGATITDDKRENLAVITATRRDTWPGLQGTQEE